MRQVCRTAVSEGIACKLGNFLGLLTNRRFLRTARFYKRNIKMFVASRSSNLKINHYESQLEPVVVDRQILCKSELDPV